MLAGFNMATQAAIYTFDNTAPASVYSDPIVASGTLYDSFSTGGQASSITDLELSLINPGPATSDLITIGLYADSSTTPGTLVSALGTISDNAISSSGGIYSVSLTSNPVLSANTRYWIGLSETGAGTARWNWSYDTSGVGVANEYASSSGYTYPNSGGPYQMAITVVPEPSEYAAYAGLALVAFGAWRRVRR